MQKIYLGLCLREAVQNPAIYTAIALAQSCINKTQYDVVRNLLSHLNCFFDLQLDTWIFFRFNPNKLLGRYEYQTELFG